MEKKVLFCATVDYHFKAFHLPYLKWFKEQGWEVHIAASGNLELPFVDKKFTISIQRSPFNRINISAYKQLKTVIEKNNYQIIHCHTPMGGVLTRLAAREARNRQTKVLYTAHGFHFCKGAPLINWMLYYPIEKFLARFTDCLITINKEDYQRAIEHKFKAGMIKHVHGVGVNTDRFKPVNENQKRQLRKKYGYKDDEFLMFYAAEFNKNKNQQLLIKALALVKDKMPKARLLLAGSGPHLDEHRKLAEKLSVDRMINFLGYRTDIESLLKISDLAVASSFREGLPVNIMEAMACGLPILASINRGHSELVKEDLNGYLVAPEDKMLFSSKLLNVYESKQLRKKFGLASRDRMKNYSISKVSSELFEIYSRYMLEGINETKSKHNRSYI